MKYAKQLLTLQQQIDVLKKRGLQMDNDAEAKDILNTISYFRLAGYWLNTINPANTFVKDIKALLAKYPVVDPAAMGFPRGWQNEPLWQ